MSGPTLAVDRPNSTRAQKNHNPESGATQHQKAILAILRRVLRAKNDVRNYIFLALVSVFFLWCGVLL